MKQPAIDLQVIKVQSRFVPMGWLSPRAPMALFKRGGGSHICEQVALKKRVSQNLSSVADFRLFLKFGTNAGDVIFFSEQGITFECRRIEDFSLRPAWVLCVIV